MKSSPNVHSQISKEQFQVWNPAEIEVAIPPTTLPKEEILAIFQEEAGGAAVPVEKRQGLYKAGTGQKFDAWHPCEAASKQNTIHEANWMFFGGIDSPFQDMREADKFEFSPAEESAPRDQKNDDEALAILEQARLQADEIILAAQAQADQILSQAQEEIDEQKKEAYQQGRDQAVSEIEETLEQLVRWWKKYRPGKPI